MGTGLAEHAPLVDRVRAALTGEPSTREVPMFGGVSFMVNDKMVVAVHHDGDLLVRVDPARHSELLARPGARPAEMGAGRTMGKGWIGVAAAQLATDHDVSVWVDEALAHNAQIVADSP